MRRESLNEGAPGYFNDFFGRGMWRFVLVQQYVTKLAQTALEYPPMQKPAVFNLDASKAKIQETLERQQGQ
jgi:arylsulfatase